MLKENVLSTVSLWTINDFDHGSIKCFILYTKLSEEKSRYFVLKMS